MNSRDTIQFRGKEYFDDRLFVSSLCKATVESDADGIIWTTIYHEQAPVEHVWCVVIYDNCPRYPISHLCHFHNKQPALDYMQSIEPETPLITLNGASPVHPVSYKDYLNWKHANNLQEFDFQSVFLSRGSNSRELIGQTKEQFEGIK